MAGPLPCKARAELDAVSVAQIFVGKVVDRADTGRPMRWRGCCLARLMTQPSNAPAATDAPQDAGANPVVPIGVVLPRIVARVGVHRGSDHHRRGVAGGWCCHRRGLGDKARAEGPPRATMSTTICCPSAADILSATLRAITVVLPPADTGQCDVIGRVG